MYAFAHKKSLGQHFLTSNTVPRWMCDAGAVGAGDTVFEIGPGTGMLTRELLSRGATVIALEADTRALQALRAEFVTAIASGQLVVHHGDARALDLTALGLHNQAYKCIANIPYYLSGYLFRLLLESDNKPATLVFLVQKEVAWRIARDQKESLLSLSVKAFGTPTYVKTVSRGHFTPPPNVASAILLVTNISKRKFIDVPENAFFTLLHQGFAARRKQLIGALAAFYPREHLETIFTDLHIPLTARGEDLSIDVWLQLAARLCQT